MMKLQKFAKKIPSAKNAKKAPAKKKPTAKKPQEPK
jgi:hypothetical protein